jgi:hypothetical protein
MGINVELQPLFDTTIIICKKTSGHSSGYAKIGWQATSAGTTYNAHIERFEELVRTEKGHEVVSRRKIFLYSTTAWSSTNNIPTVNDKIILPATHPPREPQIMMSAPVSDENGINHIF